MPFLFNSIKDKIGIKKNERVRVIPIHTENVRRRAGGLAQSYASDEI